MFYLNYWNLWKYIFQMFLYFMGSFGFVMNRKHMLVMLSSLEFIILSLLFLMFMYFLNLGNEFFFSVCKGVLGLSLLVSLIRFHRSDYFNLLNLLR